MYCGQQLNHTRLPVFRVRSACPLELDALVHAVNACHAVHLAARGWHPANLSVDLVEPFGQAYGSSHR
jgi:hypothetical protein